MTEKEKQRFEAMAVKDKARYQDEMADYHPAGGAAGGKRKKAAKDPNMPKRGLYGLIF